MSELKAKEYRRFEELKHVRPDGGEYWRARELVLGLDYAQWRNFTKAIDKAMIACNNSGHNTIYDFAKVSKIVGAGATSKSVQDYELLRYACYLIIPLPRTPRITRLGVMYAPPLTALEAHAGRFAD